MKGSTKKGSADWCVIVSTADGNAFRCLRCGELRHVPKRDGQPGLDIEEWVALGEVFTKQHRHCPPGREVKDPPPRDPDQWARGFDTGVSSAQIWMVMTGRTLHPYAKPGSIGNPPWDPSDFGRCHRLLEAFPEWRARLPEVAERWPGWAALVRDWERLTALYLEELPSGNAPRTWAAMTECLVETGLCSEAKLQRWREKA